MTTYRSVKHNGLSLLEIMISILVLSFGLIGVLASIPFGGYQMSKMNDADYTGNLARNAIKRVLLNQWNDPTILYHYLLNNNDPNYTRDIPLLTSVPNIQFHTNYDVNNNPISVIIDRTESKIDLNFPVFIDPLGNTQANLNANQKQIADITFRTRDDILYGVSEEEEGYDFRPQIYLEDDPTDNINPSYDSEDGKLLSPGITSFDTHYSWMAMLTFHESETVNIAACPINKIGQVDIDAVIFKNRVPGEDKSFQATMGGTGYQGGNFAIQLSDDTSFIQEQMKTTTHLLLSGLDDSGRQFNKWYKIANYKIMGDELLVTLIGPDTPTLWQTGKANASSITAYIFPNVCGVYSKKVLVNFE